MELVIWDIHRVPIPIDHLAKAIENPAELDADAPPPFVFGFLASMSARTSEVPRAIHYYHELEDVARILEGQTLLNTALA